MFVNDIELLLGTELSNSDKEALQNNVTHFGSTEFLLSYAENLPPFITENVFKAEGERLSRSSLLCRDERVPRNANIILSHVLFKNKTRSDGSLTCKARIAPDGNEESKKMI